MTPKQKRVVNWPTKSGYYLVENTVPEAERLDGGKGLLTVRRVMEIEVVEEGRSRYQRQSDRHPTWQHPGVYSYRVGTDGWYELEALCGHWEGLHFIPLDLDAIAAAYRGRS